MAYLFRDTELAARRLQVLAEVFAPASRAFLREVLPFKPDLALDLGCGPGYTTRLLAEIACAKQTIGLDRSAYFVAQAQKVHATAQIAFLCHDITQVPFPTELSDLLSCRLLLTHLRNPQAVIESWAGQLQVGGLLLLEEVESIESRHPVFQTYLAIVEALLTSQANQLYIGPSLDQQQTSMELKRLLSRIYRLPVSTRQAATMFSMNIPAWKDTPFIQDHYAKILEELEQSLQELAQASTGEGEIVWKMRQIAYQRV